MNPKELFEFFLKIKKERGLTTYDMHVHPFDVLGSHILHHHAYSPHQKKIPPRSLLEKLEYNAFSLRALALIFRFAPGIVTRSIRDNFFDASELRLLVEMDEAGIDKSVLVPVEPYVGARHLNAYSANPRFFRIGSVHIHALRKEEMRDNIETQIKDFSIIGLKLHPNIQHFFPDPARNPKDIAKKLREIYGIAKEKKLYILFHGGLSHLLHIRPSRVEYGLLKHFFGKEGKSELFEYRIPTVIAHLGHYNLSELNIPLMRTVAERYPHVLFDTSGTGPKLIKQAVEIAGSQKIVFGSDANYFRIKFNLILTLKALLLAHTPHEDISEKIENVFAKNFETRIIHCRAI